MPEFFEFSSHPLGKELKGRVGKIIFLQALFRYGSHILYSSQLAILHDLLSLEDSLRSCREEASTLRNKASEIAISAKAQGRPLSKEEREKANALQEDAEDYAYTVRLLRYGRWLYRYVADGIAWRAYNYHRETIRALGDKEPVPFLSNREGIDQDIKIFKGLRRLGREWLPIMHDLTNCLRTADFSVFKNGILYRVFELKVRQSHPTLQSDGQFSPHSHREARQAKRLNNALEFLTSGRLELLHPDWKGGKVLTSPTREKHNYSAISKAISIARREGYGYQEPEHGLLYLASDGLSNPIDQALKNAEEDHPHIFGTLFTFRAITPRFEMYHLSLPITAMDLPARDICDLIFGRINLICILNFQCIEAWCRINGIPLTFQHGPGRQMKIVVDLKPNSGEVQEGLWNRLLLEGLSLQSFADYLKTIINEFAIPPT